MQRGWIGPSKGVNIKFQLYDYIKDEILFETAEVFTTRVDTLYGVTFIGLSYEHALAIKLIDKKDEPKYLIKLEELNQKKQKDKKLEVKKNEKTKEGIKLHNYQAIHPLTHEKIPIFLCEYVLPVQILY